MKRSEAVERFARHINNKIQHRDDWNLALSQAEELLKIAEEFMLPPYYDDPATGYVGHIDEMELDGWFVWEEEDEK